MSITWIVLITIVGIVVLIVLAKQRKSESVGGFSYQKRDVLFSPAERSFLGVLQQAVRTDALVFGKVRVADILAPKKGLPRSLWQKHFNRISGKHFDYILCDKTDLSVLCAIELNDRSHDSKTRQARDRFLVLACASAEFPLVQITAEASYFIHEIRAELKNYLPISEAVSDVHPACERNQQQPDKVCPKCSSPLVERVAKKGIKRGEVFLACSAFPKCRYVD